jgi:predicted PurR-regulated permease PerM
VNATPERPRWSPTTKTVVVAGLIVLLVALAVVLQEILAPLFMAGILAYLLSPLAQVFEDRLRIGRGLAAGLVYLLLLALVLAALGVLIPLILDQLARLNLDFQDTLQTVQTWLGQEIYVAGFRLELGRMLSSAGQTLDGLVQPLFGHTLGVAIDVVTSLLWTVFVLVISFHLVRDRRKVVESFDNQWPASSRGDVRRLRNEIDVVWRAFFRGQLLLGLVVAALMSLVGIAVGLPFPLAMGALAGLLEFLPSIGHGIWMVTAALLMLARGSTWMPVPNWVAALIVVGIHLLFQQVDLNYLIPRFVGRRVRLHAIVVIVGVLAGAAVAGVWGVVLAAPVIASARILGRYTRARLLDEDPFGSGTPPDRTSA